jgi:hypothetical protein
MQYEMAVTHTHREHRTNQEHLVNSNTYTPNQSVTPSLPPIWDRLEFIVSKVWWLLSHCFVRSVYCGVWTAGAVPDEACKYWHEPGGHRAEAHLLQWPLNPPNMAAAALTVWITLPQCSTVVTHCLLIANHCVYPGGMKAWVKLGSCRFTVLAQTLFCD